MKRLPLLLAAVGLCASAALAHTGVQNSTVRAWMDGMKDLAAATKRLGGMAKGEIAFDPQEAQDALTQIEAHAARIPTLFETPASDPKSEAIETIWTEWDRFIGLSDDLVTVAASADVSDLDRLRQTLGQIGGTCKACHADYRE